MEKNIENLCVNTMRLLGVDAINKAKSGHPGIVLGAAPALHTLFSKHFKADPNDTNWFDRDRFILSAGHGSALLYSALHLMGYNISVEDLKQFRQLGSLTPGHPEYKHTEGVEMTTGPLGQGISTAVGFAISEAFLAAKFNKSEFHIINHYTYVLCGDGDLQEGITMEAASLAGHLGLGKLIVLYDSNDIQLDGEVSLTNSEDTQAKFEAMGWQYLIVEDGNNIEDINQAICEAKLEINKPTLIEIKTVIGYGAPNSGTSSVHGSPVGEDNAQVIREFLEYNYPPFVVDSKVYDFYNEHFLVRGEKENTNWNKMLDDYEQDYPDDFSVLNDFMFDNYSIDLDQLPQYEVGSSESTRKVMGKCVDALSIELPNIMGGSADLTPSTFVKGADGVFSPLNPLGRNIKFGVREHAMAAITNGITLHGGLKGFCSGFFVFSDYMKPAIRLAAIMHLPSVFLFSHDSVCVGEDGPTHQPIEQLAMLRSIPNLNVFRPADAVETAAAMKLAFEENNHPTCIATTRQNVEVLEKTSLEGVQKGAYIVYEPSKEITGILVTCGSEVALCIEVAKQLQKSKEYVRVVSMPSMFLFENQAKEYQEKILPTHITKRLAVEMGCSMPWYKYSRNVFGINEFGISAPLKFIPEQYGFTVENIVSIFKKL